MYLCIWKCKWAVEHERYRKEKEESTLIIILGIETKSVCPQFVVSVQPNLWQREFGSHLTHSRAYRGMETSSFFLFINVVHFGVTAIDGFVTSSSDCMTVYHVSLMMKSVILRWNGLLFQIIYRQEEKSIQRTKIINKLLSSCIIILSSSYGW